jgi:HK97 family phage major capsid protein
MPDGGNVTDIIERLGRAFEEFKETNERQVAELKKGIADAVTADKLARLNAELDKLVEAKAAAEKGFTARVDELERKVNRSRGAGDDQALATETKAFNAERASAHAAKGRAVEPPVGEDAYAGYKTAFRDWLRKGDQHPGFEMKTMFVGSDADGGFLVPADMSGRIITRVFETSPMRSVAGQQTIGTDALEGLRDLDEASAGWVAERAARPTTSTPQLGTWRVPVHEMYANPDATQKLLDDANIDVAGWLSNKVADKFGRIENTAFVVGTGINQPRGFCTYPTAATADASRAWGTFEHIATGVNANFAASNPADILFDIIQAFKPAYLGGATWATRRSVITLVRKFKGSDNNYLWQPGLQQGAPQSLLGYPIVFFEDMPALGTQSLSLALGNFRETYLIIDRAGITVLRDPYTNKPFVQFYTTRRVGGDVVQFEALKFIRFGS